MVVQYYSMRIQAILLGSLGKDLRLITVIGEFDDDDITDIDLLEIDKSIDYNGSHSKMDDSFYFNPSDYKK